MVLLGLIPFVEAVPAWAGRGPRLSDPATTFHRLYIVGPGDPHFGWHEDDSFGDDLGELQRDLERPGVTQAADSTTRTLRRPTEQQLRDAITQLQSTAVPGLEANINFIGHGGGGNTHGFPTPGKPTILSMSSSG